MKPWMRHRLLSKRDPVNLVVYSDNTYEIVLKWKEIQNWVRWRVVITLDWVQQIDFWKLDDEGRMIFVKRLVWNILQWDTLTFKGKKWKK